MNEPEDGDAVLMKVMGQRRSLGGHIGVYVAVSGEDWVVAQHITPVSSSIRSGCCRGWVWKS